MPSDSLPAKLKWIHNSKIDLKFKGSCLKPDTTLLTPINVVKIFIIYQLGTWAINLKNKFALKDCFWKLLS